MSSSWFKKLYTSAREILSSVPAAHRAAAADAVNARMTAANPGQRAEIFAATAEALASVTPTTVSHEALASVVVGRTPRADLAFLRKEALARRDGAGLVAIDEALRRMDAKDRVQAKVKANANAGRQRAAALARVAELRRKRKASEDRMASTWGGLL